MKNSERYFAVPSESHMPVSRPQPRGHAGVKIGAMLVLVALTLAPVHAAGAAEGAVHLGG